MALPTGAVLRVYDNNATALGNTPSNVADDAFSAGTSDFNAWTLPEAAVGAVFVLDWTTTSSGNNNSVINLYARLMDISGTKDAPVPTASFPQKLIGRFTNKAQTAAQSDLVSAVLPAAYSLQKYEFYIENKTGFALSSLELTVDAFSFGTK